MSHGTEQLTDELWCCECRAQRRFRKFSPKDSYVFCVECRMAFDPFKAAEQQTATGEQPGRLIGGDSGKD